MTTLKLMYNRIHIYYLSSDYRKKASRCDFSYQISAQDEFQFEVLGWITIELMHIHTQHKSPSSHCCYCKTHKHNTDSLYLIDSYHGGSLTQRCWDMNEVLTVVCEL